MDYARGIPAGIPSAFPPHAPAIARSLYACKKKGLPPIRCLLAAFNNSTPPSAQISWHAFQIAPFSLLLHRMGKQYAAAK